MDKSTLIYSSLSLISGSVIIFYTARYYANSIANISFIQDNLLNENNTFEKNKIIYFKGYPTVLSPANDKDYLVFPKNAVVLKRKVQIYSVKTRLEKSGNDRNNICETYYWKTLSSQSFYCDKVKIGDFFIEPRVLETYYRNFKPLYFSDEIRNFSNWLNEVQLKHQTNYKYTEKSDCLEIRDSNVPSVGDKRISYEKLEISPKTVMSGIGLLSENKLIKDVCVDINNKFTSKLLIQKGDKSPDELISNEVKIIRKTFTKAIILGTAFNTFGFYFFNKSMFEFLTRNGKFTMNWNSFRLISNLITFGFSGFMYYIISSSEKEKLSKKVHLKSIAELNSNPIMNYAFNSGYRNNKESSESKSEEIEISNKNI